MVKGDILLYGSPRKKVFENIADLLYHRGNLSNIKNIIKTYNATHPPEGPFNVKCRDGSVDYSGLLAHAACSCELEYVQWFLKHGCDPLEKTLDGETVFHKAISQNMIFEIDYGRFDEKPSNSSMGTIMTLLHHMEDLEKRKKTKLEKIWEMRNDWHKTPLDYAARKGGAEVLKLFISKGAKINGPLFSTQYGEISDTDRGTLKKIRIPDPVDRSGNLYTQFGTSLLHQAIEYDNPDAFDVLMIDGAHTHVYDNRGETPLMCAIRCSNFEAIKRLIASPGIDISQLHGRIFRCIREEWSHPVLEQRSLPQIQCKNWTALHMLALAHHDDESPHIVSVIEMLLNAGASVSMKNAQGQTPCDIARIHGNETMVAVFDKWDADRKLAVWMGKHDRLGGASSFEHLSDDIIDMINKI
jgi:ankyrin repeat protein